MARGVVLGREAEERLSGQATASRPDSRSRGFPAQLHHAPRHPGRGILCRYHEFVERGWPFTRGHGVDNADLVALLSEYAMIAAVAATVVLALGLVRGG